MKRSCWLLFAPLATSPAVAGSEVVYAPHADWVELSAVPTGAAARKPIMLFDQQLLIEDGRQSTYLDQIFNISSPELAQQAGTVTMSWLPQRGDLTVHEVSILRDGKVIDALAGGEGFTVLRREEQLETAVITGQLTATMPVAGLRVGDRLRYRVTIDFADPLLGRAPGYRAPLLAHPAPVGTARMRLLWPTTMAVDWRTPMLDLAPVPIKRGNKQGVEFTLPAPEAKNIPADAPARYRLNSLLVAAPRARWRDLSRQFADFYRPAGLIDPDGELAREVAKIRAQSEHPKERAAAALKLVQDELRYLAVGLNEGAYRPVPPEDSWAARVGDCKAKTLLLLAILHELGIPGEAVMVNAMQPDALIDALPAMALFDHVLVHVRHDGEDWWLDGTQSGTRLADLTDPLATRVILPIRADGAEPLDIVPRQVTRPTGRLTIEYDKSAGLALPTPYKASVEVRGAMAKQVAAYAATASAKQRIEMANGMLYDQIGKGTIVSADIDYIDELGIARVTAEGLANQSWSYLDETGTRTLRVNHLGNIPPVEDRTRASNANIPLALPVPFFTERNTTVILPGADFKLNGDPRFAASLLGYAMTSDVTLAGSRLDVRQSIRTTTFELPAEKIGVGRAELARLQSHRVDVLAPARLRAMIDQPGVKDPKLSARIERLYRTEIEGDDPANGHSNLARFFAGIYRFDAAQPHFAAAAKANATSDHRLALAENLIRLKRFPEAAAQLDALMADEPDNLNAKFWRVYLDLLGHPYPDAEAELRAMKLADNHADYLTMTSYLIQLMALAGRKDEARAAIDAMLAGRKDDSDALNIACWVAGLTGQWLDDAIDWCNRALDRRSGSAVPLLDSRALVRYRRGELAEAAKDLDDALTQDPGSGDALFTRGLVRLASGDRGGKDDIALANRIGPNVQPFMARFGLIP